MDNWSEKFLWAIEKGSHKKSNQLDLKMGDFILFENKQKYIKPILAIFLGSSLDDVVGFYYICWREDFDEPKIEKQNWSDHIKILRHWSERPTDKELLRINGRKRN